MKCKICQTYSGKNDLCYGCASKKHQAKINDEKQKEGLIKQCVEGSTQKCSGTLHLVDGYYICSYHYERRYDSTPTDSTSRFLLKCGKDSIWWKKCTKEQRAAALDYEKRNGIPKEQVKINSDLMPVDYSNSFKF